MGGGIAQLGADKGLPARMKDVDPKALAHGFAAAAAVWREALKKRRLTAREMATEDGPALGHARLLGVLALRGDRSRPWSRSSTVKRAVLEEWEAAVPRTAIFASNTSTLPITRDRRRRARAGARRGDALLQPGPPDAARRSHPRRADERRNRRDGLRPGEDARQDARRRQGRARAFSSTGSWRRTSRRRCVWSRRAAASRTSTRR